MNDMERKNEGRRKTIYKLRSKKDEKANKFQEKIIFALYLISNHLYDGERWAGTMILSMNINTFCDIIKVCV